jgi:hypothetical protein
MYTVYASPVFKNADGTQRLFKIPTKAWSTYTKRDAALLEIIALGGIRAKPSAELTKLRSKMMSCKRKIERNSWYSTTIDNVGIAK